jgi:hypothetical protein
MGRPKGVGHPSLTDLLLVTIYANVDSARIHIRSGTGIKGCIPLPTFLTTQPPFTPPPSRSDRWLTLGQTWRRSNAAQARLRCWVDAGQVPTSGTSGGHRRFVEGDRHAILNGHNKLLRARFGIGWVEVAGLLLPEARRRGVSTEQLARVLAAGLRSEARERGAS